jgi:hypothetical protein
VTSGGLLPAHSPTHTGETMGQTPNQGTISHPPYKLAVSPGASIAKHSGTLRIIAVNEGRHTITVHAATGELQRGTNGQCMVTSGSHALALTGWHTVRLAPNQEATETVRVTVPHANANLGQSPISGHSIALAEFTYTAPTHAHGTGAVLRADVASVVQVPGGSPHACLSLKQPNASSGFPALALILALIAVLVVAAAAYALHKRRQSHA